MTHELRLGAGRWHFGQFRDRYATDGYGPPVSTLDAINRAAIAAQRVIRAALLGVHLDGMPQ